MKKAILHTIFLFLIVSLYPGCSTNKNTRVSRAYHNLTSHYNIFFNAKESMASGLERIDKAIEDDYTQILPIFKDSDPSAAKACSSDMENVILKASKLIKIHSITKKPKRRKNRTRRYKEFASKEEFNNWIDDSYLIMGEAYFYQDKFISAIDNFSYVVRKFSEEESKYKAFIWLIRCYTEMERFIEASEVIQMLQGDDNFPKKLEKELAIVTADYYMRLKDYDETIKFLDIAINKIFWKKQKARLQYILAQLYQETGRLDEASAAFREVTRLNAPYKMAFNARINAAGVFTGKGNAEKLKKELKKMLRDKKNEEFKDQVYYALGNIFFKEGNRERAIDNYRNSVAYSISNSFQLARSAITLGDIYFEDLEYRKSQAYYDSAMIVIEENYPNYENISERYKNLSTLVDNLLTVEREDSLQRIALMSESERNALIDKLVREEEDKQKQMDLQARQGSSGSGFYRANQYRFGLGSNRSVGGWYFYNPQTVSFGKVQFQQRWGRRKLEDNWRRANKTSISGEFDEFTELVDSLQVEQRVKDPLKREYYTQELPLNDSLMALSHERIKDALYNAGKIFKAEFKDYERSIEEFEDLNKRYPDNVYTLSAYFDLYDLYELLGNKERSDYYRSLIIKGFPDSKYAKYLLNPNFFIDMEAQKDSLNRLYQYTFSKYKSGQYPQVIALTGQMKELDPDSTILSKIDFLRAVALGTQSDMKGFESLLKDYVKIYPGKETTTLANDILSLIEDSTLADYQKLVEIGYLNDQIQNEEMMPGNRNEDDEFGGKFEYDEDLLHYFVIAYPRSADVDVNRLKFDIANYNIDYYTKLDFDIETVNLDSKTAFVVVRSLENKRQSLIYFRSIIRHAEVFQSLKNVDYINIVASSTNYRAILADKSLSDYLRFFVKNYSHFVGSNFNEDDKEEKSPEELMAKAEEDDEKLEEQGTFVMVTASSQFSGGYNTNIDTMQSFVLAVKEKNTSLRTTLTQFSSFNRSHFRTWNLALQLKTAGEYQLMVIKGIPGFAGGMSYFRSVVTERKLFSNLGRVSYRNFLITDSNLEELIKTGGIDEYINFFRKYYIQAAATMQRTPSKTVRTTTSTGQATPGKTVAAGVKPVAQKTGVKDKTYNGPYSTAIEAPHYFLMIIPRDGVDNAAFIQGIAQFNAANFASAGLTIDEQPLDKFRWIVRISGLKDKTVAMQYARQIVRNRTIYQPLGDANYRNFLISEENFNIFLQKKNITGYMDFYKRIYLGK